MKKLLGIVVLGLLLCNKSYSDQWDFSKIEHFKCYYDKTTAAYIDHQGTKELKLKEPQIFDKSIWKIVISRIDYINNKANIIFGSSNRVEDVFLINKNVIGDTIMQIDFFYPNSSGVGSEFITIYNGTKKNGSYYSVHTSHGNTVGPAIYTYFGWCLEN